LCSRCRLLRKRRGLLLLRHSGVLKSHLALLLLRRCLLHLRIKPTVLLHLRGLLLLLLELLWRRLLIEIGKAPLRLVAWLHLVMLLLMRVGLLLRRRLLLIKAGKALLLRRRLLLIKAGKALLLLRRLLLLLRGLLPRELLLRGLLLRLLVKVGKALLLLLLWRRLLLSYRRAAKVGKVRLNSRLLLLRWWWWLLRRKGRAERLLLRRRSLLTASTKGVPSLIVTLNRDCRGGFRKPSKQIDWGFLSLGGNLRHRWLSVSSLLLALLRRALHRGSASSLLLV
jgi:hypothetical protein